MNIIRGEREYFSAIAVPRGNMVVVRYAPTLLWFSIFALSSSIGLDLTKFSRAPKSSYNLRLRTTSRAPEACNCAQVQSKKVGICYFYTDESSGACGSRPCRKSYQCTSVITGLTCMRRRTSKKIVPIPQAAYSCRTVRTDGIMYVPYANRPIPRKLPTLPRVGSAPSNRRLPQFDTQASNRRPLEPHVQRPNILPPQSDTRASNIRHQTVTPAKPTPSPSSTPIIHKKPKKKRPSRFFMVVAGESVLGVYPKLSTAKKILKRFSPRSKRRRAIFEIRKGKVGKDPRKVGGKKNQAGGLKNGFNKFWWNKNDVKAMYKSAVTYMMARTFKKGKPDYFIVVAGKIVMEETRSLREAQKTLMKFGTKSRRGRCVFEVVKGKVGPDPRRVGGRNQQAGLRGGFNTFWLNKKDLGRMYKLAVDYTILRQSFKDPFEDVSGNFIVVVGKKTVGRYRKLAQAKYALMQSKSIRSTQGRCIFQVIRGKVNPDPRTIAGQAQINGMKAGFNRFWWGINDIKKMYIIAAKYNARG